jgi:hypothetical protein
VGKDDQSSGDPFHSGHTRVLNEGDIPTGPKKDPGPSSAPATFNAGDAWGAHTRALSPEMFDGLELANNDNVPHMPGSGGGGGGGGNQQRSGKTMAMPLEAAQSMLPGGGGGGGGYPRANDPKTAAMPPGHGGYPPSSYPPPSYPAPSQAPPAYQAPSFPSAPSAPPSHKPSSSGGGGGGGGGGIPYLETQAIESPMIQAQAAALAAQQPYPSHGGNEPVEKTTLLDTSNVDQYRQQYPQYGAPQQQPSAYPPPQQHQPQQGFDSNGLAVGGEKTVLIQDVQSLLPPHLAGVQQQPGTRGKLIIFVPDTDPIEFELMPGITTVGRGMENHLVLGDPYASRKHMVITCKDGRYSFEDTGSDNGTVYNGRRGSQSPLTTGDILEIGSVQMRFVQGSIGPEHLHRPAPSAPSARGGILPAPVGGAVQPLPIQNLGAARKRGPSKMQLFLLVTLIVATLGLIAVMVYIYLGRG